MRGVTYQEDQDRWKCAHTSKGKAYQFYYADETEALLNKIKLCIADGVTPFEKKVKSYKSVDSSLPIGLSDCKRSGDRHFILARVVTKAGEQKREFAYGKYRTREQAVALSHTWRNNELYKRLKKELAECGLSKLLVHFTEFLKPTLPLAA
jgi:hypothetical protein